MSKSLVIVVAAAVLIGVLAVWVDLHSLEVQPAIAILVAGGIVLGFAAPRYAWGIGVIIGGAIPVGHIVARIVNYPVPYPVELPFTFLALVPAVIGALTGAKIRPTLDGMMKREPKP